MKLWVGMSLLSCLSLFLGCRSPVVSHPAVLARHWVCVSDPRYHGLNLKIDGSGREEGLDTTAAGSPIKWQCQDGKLQLMRFGEEGEHGQFASYSFTVSGEVLKISPPFEGCDRYREIRRRELPGERQNSKAK